MSRDKVIADVSQHTREAGRMPAHQRMEKDSDRRAQLCEDKRRIEAELSLLEAERRDELAMCLRRNGNKTANVIGTLEIDAKFGKRRSALITAKQAVDIELGDLKRRRMDKPRQDENDGHIGNKMVVLLNIETLLKRVVQLLEEKK
jgi:hypothetical protein